MSLGRTFPGSVSIYVPVWAYRALRVSNLLARLTAISLMHGCTLQPKQRITCVNTC